MPLILAIEPDRRQASRITALAREELHAEIVVTGSAEQALEALAKRTPDLILTPQLLSPKDESALDARLRELDAAGSNVQTLMIPMLSASSSRSGKKDGLLGRLRRTKDAAPSTDGGCDPAVFAAQIREYLERAAEDRATRAAMIDDGHIDESAAGPRPSIREPKSVAPVVEADASIVQTPSTFNVSAEFVPDVSQKPDASAAAEQQPDVYVPQAAAYDSPIPAYVPPTYESLASPQEAFEPYVQRFDEPPSDPYVATVAPPIESAPPLVESAPFVPEPQAVVAFVPEPQPTVAFVAEVAAVTLPEPVEAFVEPTPAYVEPAHVESVVAVAHDPFREFVEFDDLSLVDLPSIELGELASAMGDRFEAAREETVLDALELLDGPEISATLDPEPESLAVRNRRQPAPVLHSVKSSESEPEPSFDDFDFDADLWMPLPLAASRWPTLEGPNVKAALMPGFDAPPDEEVEYAPVVKKTTKRGKPAQDEWGLFDPAQCGFAALLAKLDEVTDKDDMPGEPSPAR